MNAYIETYGCSLNKADSESIKSLLLKNDFCFTSLQKADYVILNACAVKEQTENRMIKRIKELLKEKNPNSKLIVFGCLAKINPERVREISSTIALIPPDLKELTEFLGIKFRKDVSLIEASFNEFTSIIQICRGCLSNCSFCAVRIARGKLKSRTVKELKQSFIQAVKESKEVWLTAQDTAQYGKDVGESLPFLLKELLKAEGDYRIRIGMMNPHYLNAFLHEFIPLFKDKRIYKFLHIPLQSGSNKILKLMNRKYSVEEYLALIKELRKEIPELSISTDIIVGFPSETESDFNKTIKAVKEINPDVLNISRYGERPFTQALKLKNKLHGREKKKRSRILSSLHKELALEKNKKLIGRTEEILVTEKGPKGGFIGRSISYKPVAIKENRLGEFIKVRITSASPFFLEGIVQE